MHHMTDYKTQPRNKQGSKKSMLLQLFFLWDLNLVEYKTFDGLAFRITKYLIQWETQKKNHGHRDLGYKNLRQITCLPGKRDLCKKTVNWDKGSEKSLNLD